MELVVLSSTALHLLLKEIWNNKEITFVGIEFGDVSSE